MKPIGIAILGSTGSIGRTTLDIVRKHPQHLHVVSLAAGDNIALLAEQIDEFRPQLVATRTDQGLKELRQITSHSNMEWSWGAQGAVEVAQHPNAQYVVSAIVGAAGLRPTLAAAEAGKVIALANKESLVVAGAYVCQIVEKNCATIIPVDSEHSAIFQCLGHAPHQDVAKLILTASGGPFFSQKDKLDFWTVTPQQALAHPNWSMGDKISIDSATMMNKGLEAIEAHWLFKFPANRIDVVVHPQSIIHSMVEFTDGSVIAQLGVPDMAGPIAYALSYPNRLKQVIPSLHFGKLRQLTFFDPDHQQFPSIELALQALQTSPSHPAVLNAANEVSVRAFLDQRIAFPDIFNINRGVLESYQAATPTCLEDYFEADAWARRYAEQQVKEIK